MSNQKGQDHRKNIQQTQFNGQNGSMQPSLQQNFFQQQQYQQTQQLQIQQLQQQDNQKNLTNTQNNEQNGFVQPNLQQDLLQQKQYQQIQQLQQQFYQQKTKNMATLKTNNNTQNEINQLGQTSKMNTDQKNGNLNEKQATLIKTIESEKKNQPFSKDQLLTNQKELNNKDFYVKKKEIEIIKSHQSQKGYYVKNDEINQKKETTNRTKKFQINDNKENKINENESKKNNKFNKLRNENGNENDEKLKDENDNSKKNQDEESKENIQELQDENKLENKNKQLLQGNNNQIETIIEKKKYIKENEKGIEINDNKENKEKEKDKEKEIKGVTKDEDQFKEYESQNKETTINKSYKNEKNQETEQQEIKYFPQQAVDDNSRYSDTPMDKKSLFSYFFSDNESVPEYVNNRTTVTKTAKTINNGFKKKTTSKNQSNKNQKLLKSGFANRFLFDIDEDENENDNNNINNNKNNKNISDEFEISEKVNSQNKFPQISRSSQLLNQNINIQKENTDEKNSFSTYSSESIPKYIFDSLQGGISNILKEDQVSCFLVTPYYFIVGTEKGFIIKIDFQGNIISKQLIHQLNVNIISVNKNGKYICTCSNDGMICIIGVKSKHKKIYSYHQPIRSVAINPKYPKKKKVFAVGLKNGDIIIASSGMMRSKVHIISQDEGQIYSIDWKGSYIVWASTNGISVYSIKQKMLIGNYKESILFPQSSLYHSIFHWISERRFIVAWSTFFKVFKINTKKKNTSIMCIKNINFDSIISGVCKYKDLFIVLSGEDEEKQILIKKTEVKITNLKNQSKNLKGPLKDNNSNNEQNIIKEYVTIKKRELIKKYPPKITFISNENFQIVSKELIEIGDYDKYCYFDYRIDNSNEQFFLVSPWKIYIGRLRRIDEVVDWLLEKNRFHEALKIGRNNISKLKSHQINDIGFQLLMYYIKNDYWEQAAIECKDICKNNHNLWIDIIEIFLQHHKFKYLYKCIPMKSPQFSRKFYEKILINCINDRLWDELIYCVQFWPTAHYSDELLIPTLKQVLKNDFFYINPIFIKNIFYYDTKFIENSQNDKDVNIDSKNIEDGKNNQGGHDNKKKNEKSDDEKENEFLKVINCLFQLYYYCENYYPVLIISVYYKFINPYNLITQYKLFSNLELLVMPLIKYDHKKTINFFVKHSDQIPIEMVINEFEKKKELNQYYLYEYLDALFEKSPKIGEKYHFLLFKLYSEYNRSKIFDILNLSTSIPLDKAVLICKKKNFFEETVKIYDMMGNYIDCLKIKLTNCENMESIIKYVESKKDKDLWHQLIDHCLVHPKYLSVLLEKLPRTGIDFLEIVNKIPKRTKIDQLKENICNIILDRQIFIELMKVTNISIKNDSSYLLNLLNQKKQSGVLIDHTLTCSICQLPIKKLDMQYRIFNCGHYFHENCLTQYLINSHEIEIGKPLIKKNQKKKKNSVNVLNSVNKSITPPIQQISFFCVICQKSNKDPFW
ncbi:vacuolar protein sorting-associated protein 41 [Anaeramoeba flamelloides]|uniref:Vacuolar protein sorting-associated protein 41 n=1 Tax=Anaeramoeba flamelloides TaxID=1746091 RepID=A0AAV8A6I9_9EUKA|nr:vacuolar protein sorting-associated protein 41 [Anaeramoeba flamelloides]